MQLKSIFFIGISLMVPLCALQAQITVDDSRTPADLVSNVLLGSGVEASNITFNGNAKSIGAFSDPTSFTGFSDGIILSTGLAARAAGPNDKANESFGNNGGSDPDLNKLTSGTTRDATVLEFDFRSLGDEVVFRYVFASEEYPEFVGQKFNDVFGFFVTGPLVGNKVNMAVLPNTGIPVSINTVNATTNSTFYRDNTGGVDIQYDGLTTVLTVSFKTIPCQKYHIKLAISDVEDINYDSGVFLEGKSFISSSPEVVSIKAFSSTKSRRMREGCNTGEFCFERTSAKDSLLIKLKIDGLATNGVDYTLLPDSLWFAPGQFIICLPANPFIDGIADGGEWIRVSLDSPKLCDPVIDSLLILDPDSSLSMDTIPDDTVCKGSGVPVIPQVHGGSGQFTFLWSTGSTASFEYLAPDTTTTYWVRITDSCSGKIISDTFTIFVKPIPDASLAPSDTLICRGDAIQLRVTGGQTWVWDPNPWINDTTLQNPTVNPQVDTRFKVNVYVDSLECPVGLEALVRVFRVFTGPDRRVCIVGDSVQLYVEPSDRQAYLWSPPFGLSSTTVARPKARPSSSVDYFVQVTDTSGCRDIAQVRVSVDTVPKANAGPDGFFCGREGYLLSASGGNFYVWKPASALDSPFSKSPTAFPLTTTDYEVTVYNGACFARDTAVVKVVDTVTAQFISERPDDCARFIQFTNQSQPLGKDFIWDFGDGGKDTTLNPGHNYATKGEYTVVLTYYPGTACEDTARRVVKIEERSFDPEKFGNVFTPNGDGINDVFGVEDPMVGCPVKLFKVYNRWGEILFRSEDRKNMVWDGTHKGGKVVEGTYFFVLLFESGAKQEGTVTLIR